MVRRATPAEISTARKRLENPYAFSDGDNTYAADVAVVAPSLDPASVRNRKPSRFAYSDDELKARVRRIHTKAWRSLQTTDRAGDPFDVLDPSFALSLLGYVVEKRADLGHVSDADGTYRVAGLIDGRQHRVFVQESLDPVVSNYTLAHELGHAVLHRLDQPVHRDRPIDGSDVGTRNREEVEADKFASLYLMPEKLVVSEFQARFETDELVCSTDLLYTLDSVHFAELDTVRPALREFARLVAKAIRFHVSHFDSMAARFGVSTEAMAIRLEELSLVRV